MSAPAGVDPARPAAVVPAVRRLPFEPDALPYRGRVRRWLPAMRRVFLALNRWWSVPAIKAGLGPLHSNPLTGPQLLLRTVGRRSGRVREVALGYAIVDGNVYVCAGFGARTAWLRNLRAEPRVELVLPGGAVAGIAEEVRDPIEAERAWRGLIRALGVLGRGLVCPADAPVAELAVRTAGLPLVRIRPTGLGNGPADPGGYQWASFLALATGWWLLRRRARGRDRRRSIG